MIRSRRRNLQTLRQEQNISLFFKWLVDHDMIMIMIMTDDSELVCSKFSKNSCSDLVLKSANISQHGTKMYKYIHTFQTHQKQLRWIFFLSSTTITLILLWLTSTPGSLLSCFTRCYNSANSSTIADKVVKRRIWSHFL